MREMSISPSRDARRLGETSIMVSPIAWGMWRLPDIQTGSVRTLIEAAFESGITFFDTAAVYGTSSSGGFGGAETLLGRALAEDRTLRDRMVIATKGGIAPPVPYDSSAEHLLAAADDSLRRLQIDVIDLYQIHRRDFLTHPQEVARVLSRLVEQGKVRTVGVSNYLPEELRALQRFLSIPIASTQPQFSALHVAPLFDGTLDQAMADRIAVLAWSPLGGGRLWQGDSPVLGLFEAQGNAYGVDAAAAALSWVMCHPAQIVPIIGSQQPERIKAAAMAHQVAWTRQQWYSVLQAGAEIRLP